MRVTPRYVEIIGSSIESLAVSMNHKSVANLSTKALFDSLDAITRELRVRSQQFAVPFAPGRVSRLHVE